MKAITITLCYCYSFVLSISIDAFTFPVVPKQAYTNIRQKMSLTAEISNSGSNSSSSAKRIVFLRHGRTHMNDLINGIHYGTPGFTDIFESEQDQYKYHDSPLGPTGLEQVQNLNEMLGLSLQNENDNELSNILQELDLVVTSPLTRALQTMEMGMKEHLSTSIPILALPQAAERVYMVSDIGKTRHQLKQSWPGVDFDSEFIIAGVGDHDPWHFVPTQQQVQEYTEWRPNGQGQVYACLGEPQVIFDQRMTDLYCWLNARPEATIAVVCHAGVIDWMLQEIVDNCELRVVAFDNLKPRALRT